MQGISQPTQPTQPNLKTSIKNQSKTLSEPDKSLTSSNQTISPEGLSRLSRSSNPSQTNGSSPTQPLTGGLSRLSNEVESVSSATDTSDNDEVSHGTMEEEKNNSNQNQNLESFSEKLIRDVADELQNYPDALQDLQDVYELDLIKAACQLLPSEVIDRLREFGLSLS
jgi:hypothetical protein